MFFGPTPVPEGIRRCDEIRAEVSGNLGAGGLDAPLARRAARDGGPLRARPGAPRRRYRDFQGARTDPTPRSPYLDESSTCWPAISTRPKGASVGYLALEKMGDKAFRPTTAAHLAEAVYAQGRDDDAGR